MKTRTIFPVNAPVFPASTTPTTLQSLPRGVGGVRQTIKIMRRIAREYKRDITIRELSLELVRGETHKNWLGEISRLFEFVRDRIRYVRDINGVETIATPVKTLEYGQGDCDDKAVLLAAMLESIGHPARFRAVAFAGGGFSHVFVETRLGAKWIALETTEPVKLGWIPPNITKSMLVNV